MLRKVCRVCQEPLPLTDFSRARRNRDGYRTACKTCESAYTVDYVRRRKAADPAYAQRMREADARYRQRVQQRPRQLAYLRVARRAASRRYAAKQKRKQAA